MKRTCLPIFFLVLAMFALISCAHESQDKVLEIAPDTLTQAQDRKLPILNTANTDKIQPNILWIITDDHRPDSVSAYNKAIYGQSESPLGYIESPNADQLAQEGVLFTQAFTNSPVCAPSRAALHSGRYPFRTGRFAFELSHPGPDFSKPLLSEYLKGAGYYTAMFGKEDHYFMQWGPGQSFNKLPLFDFRVHFKHDLQNHGIGDIYTRASYGDEPGNSTPIGYSEYVNYPDGTSRSYLIKSKEGEVSEQDLQLRSKTDEEFDILRSYTRSNPNLIIGGVNPNTATETIDAKVVRELRNHLENAKQTYSTLSGKPAEGADSDKPLFVNLGFHLPHTPVLPPKSVRDRFKTKEYKVPKFELSEVEKLPLQLQKMYHATKITGMTDAEVQQAIQDYYAFTAHGDELIGEAVDAFKAYSKQQGRPWVVVYTVGDHGWHLGEQGIEAKFGPWQQSVANAAIITASDKSLVPRGLVNHDLVEFVDFAPTILDLAGVDIKQERFNHLDGYSLLDVAAGEAPKREYILGETNVVVGPRAYLHSKRFRFSMRTRPPGAAPGERMRWALDADANDVDMALYDLAVDPLERQNVADTEAYRPLALWLRNKLGNIVLGDGRIEVDWSQENSYVESNFAEGADDKRLDIPKDLIPSVPQNVATNK
ncbi:sulfatase-like hydrolase/transferase [Alteromonas stellipolaris]|uniref:sulfatase-like hydrolase/transferase n=1 Tax=Alteromonas stellipolaris TaxID=233316 RepID=UPI003BA8C211